MHLKKQDVCDIVFLTRMKRINERTTMNDLQSRTIQVLIYSLLVLWILPLNGWAAAPNAEENPADSPPTLYVAGDSTASNGAENGWGSHLQKFFDPEQLSVINRARGGRSSRTFVTEGLWDGILENLRAGDTVIIQFGHNDAGAINDDRRARGSIPSLGEETQEIDNQMTGRHEVVHTFGWYMRKMINETKFSVPVIKEIISYI